MSKTKKIVLISVVGALVLAIAGYFVYVEINKVNSAVAIKAVEQQGLNNISGIVSSIDGNNINTVASVPDNFTPYSKGGYSYVDKPYILKTSSSTQMLSYVSDTNYNELFDLSAVKPGDRFSATSKENIMNNSELNVVEIIFYR